MAFYEDTKSIGKSQTSAEQVRCSNCLDDKKEAKKNSVNGTHNADNF